MTPFKPHHLATLALAWACTAPAQAGNLTANASQNLSPPVSQVSPGSLATAQFMVGGVAVAGSTVTRTGIAAFADGTGVEVTELRAANGNARNDYLLWDLAANAPLDDSWAATLTLAFDFRVSGVSALPPVSLSTMAVSYDAAVFSGLIETAGSAVSAVYGPIPPFPSEGYAITGNAALVGSFDIGFSLLHAQRTAGLLTMGFGVQAAKAGDATGSLALSGVRLVSGVLPAGGLAVRMETGEMLTVSAVPELPTLPMALAGVLVLGLLARRRGLGR